MRKLYLALAITMLVCLGCEWHLRSGAAGGEATKVSIERYDLIETLYLTTGDYAALGQLNTSYPRQTRMLIEDILQLGKVDDPNINQKFLHFFQDSTLLQLISEVEHQYKQTDDLDKELTDAFEQLCHMLPSIEVPQIYAQIGSLDQSIVVSDGMLGISLDKYLGSDNPLYLKYGYSEQQRAMMQRSYIVPDCLGFYLLSLYPLPAGADSVQQLRDAHMGRIQWVVNRAMQRKVFTNEFVVEADKLMRESRDMSVEHLLKHI